MEPELELAWVIKWELGLEPLLALELGLQLVWVRVLEWGWLQALPPKMLRCILTNQRLTPTWCLHWLHLLH